MDKIRVNVSLNPETKADLEAMSTRLFGKSNVSTMIEFLVRWWDSKNYMEDDHEDS